MAPKTAEVDPLAGEEAPMPSVDAARPELAEAADAAEDAWLAENMADEGELIDPRAVLGVTEDEAPAQEERGGEEPEGASGEEAAEEPEQEESHAGDSTPEPVELEKPTPEQVEAREKAIAALRLDGWDAEDIDGLDEGQLLKMGAKARERRSKNDRALEERAQRIRELEEQARQAPEDSGVPAEPPASPDLKEVLQPFVQKVTDEYGDTLGQQLEAMGLAIAEAVKPPPAPAPAKQSGDSGQMAMQIAVTQAKEKLAAEYPGVDFDEPSVAEPLVARFKTLAKTGDYAGLDGVHQAMRHAARIEFGDPPKPRDPEREESISRAKDISQPTSTSRHERPKTRTLDDRETDVLLALEGGGTPDDAKKAYGR